MKPQLQVGFLASQNYFDKNACSGKLYHMHQALSSRNLKLVNLGSPEKPCILQRFFQQQSFKKALPQVSHHFVPNYLKFAGKVQNQLKTTPCDIIVASLIDPELNLIQTNTPIIKVASSTFKLSKKDILLNTEPEEMKWLQKQECFSLAKAKKLVYSSAWAAASAIWDYGIEPAKIEVIPFGANLDNVPSGESYLSKKTGLCRLLFIGNWQKHGGEIAFQTLVSLCKRGWEAELTVVGCTPPSEIKHQNLTVIPYLDKNYPHQQQQLYKLFANSHFLIFPSQVECDGTVLCEANAFGLPVIASEIGSTPTIIRNGKNGYVLPLSASGEDYAKLIMKNLDNLINYQKLVAYSRTEYEKRLNWDRWAESLHQLMLTMVR